MRLDDDSKILGRWFNVFDEMCRKNAVYFANNVDIDLEDQLPGTMNMQRVTFDYNYYNNFEISKVEFFRREEVRRWVDAIDSTHGIFKYRWSDAILGYLTLAVFAEQNEVLHKPDYVLPYCHKCRL
ncbi:unnamed protein product [Rotaria sp. Silwood2]|nr:unnamed protein product [Rotaria sp. Silwood2]